MKMKIRKAKSVSDLMADGRPRTLDDILNNVDATIPEIQRQIIAYRDTPACCCSESVGYRVYQQRRVGK